MNTKKMAFILICMVICMVNSCTEKGRVFNNPVDAESESFQNGKAEAYATLFRYIDIFDKNNSYDSLVPLISPDYNDGTENYASYMATSKKFLGQRKRYSCVLTDSAFEYTSQTTAKIEFGYLQYDAIDDTTEGAWSFWSTTHKGRETMLLAKDALGAWKITSLKAYTVASIWSIDYSSPHFAASLGMEAYDSLGSPVLSAGSFVHGNDQYTGALSNGVAYVSNFFYPDSDSINITATISRSDGAVTTLSHTCRIGLARQYYDLGPLYTAYFEWNDYFYDPAYTMPARIEVDDNNQIWLPDYNNGAELFANNGTYLGLAGYDSLTAPYAIAFSPTSLYVAERFSGNIDRIAINDKTNYALDYATHFGDTFGGTTGYFSTILDLTVANNSIFVSEDGVQGISHHDSLGTYLGALTPGGTTSFFPNALCADSLGNVFASDLSYPKIYKIIPSLAFTTYTLDISRNQSAAKPYTASSLAIDGNGIIFVASHYFHCVFVYKSDMTLLGSIGSRGSAKGEFIYPYDIVVKNNYLYVWDSSKRTIQSIYYNFDSLL